MKVVQRFFFLFSILLLQLFIFLSFVEARKCTSGGVCTAISQFDYKAPLNGSISTKDCGDDVCALFWCLVDSGKKVNVGFGCYSDYVTYCGDISNNAKLNLTTISITGLDGQGPNAKVFACKPEIEGKVLEDCAKDMYSLKYSLAEGFFTGEFKQGADMSYDQQCEYLPAPSSSARNQMNGFKLFGIILIGLMLAQFW